MLAYPGARMRFFATFRPGTALGAQQTVLVCHETTGFAGRGAIWRCDAFSAENLDFEMRQRRISRQPTLFFRPAM